MNKTTVDGVVGELITHWIEVPNTGLGGARAFDGVEFVPDETARKAPPALKFEFDGRVSYGGPVKVYRVYQQIKGGAWAYDGMFTVKERTPKKHLERLYREHLDAPEF